MQQEILDRVNTLSEEMLLHYASPNKNLIVEVLQTDASMLDQIDAAVLGKYIFVLGQYLVMLTYNQNMKSVEYMTASTAFEHELNKELFRRDDVVGKTVKERRAWMLLHNEELNKMYKNVIAREAEKMMMADMVKSVEGLLNAIKKEKSGRQGEHYNS